MYLYNWRLYDPILETMHRQEVKMVPKEILEREQSRLHPPDATGTYCHWVSSRNVSHRSGDTRASAAAARNGCMYRARYGQGMRERVPHLERVIRRFELY